MSLVVWLAYDVYMIYKEKKMKTAIHSNDLREILMNKSNKSMWKYSTGTITPVWLSTLPFVWFSKHIWKFKRECLRNLHQSSKTSFALRSVSASCVVSTMHFFCNNVIIHSYAWQKWGGRSRMIGLTQELGGVWTLNETQTKNMVVNAFQMIV